MAARRLIAILLVLLFLSSLAAALAPVQEGTQTDSSSTTSAESTGPATLPEDAKEARVVEQTVDHSARGSVRIPVRVGDRLELKVTSQRSGTVELAGLGPAEDVGPRQPAFFDVLLRDEGSHSVRYLRGEEREIALVKVSAPRTAPFAR